MLPMAAAALDSGWLEIGGNDGVTLAGVQPVNVATINSNASDRRVMSSHP